jgi:hypothetical protein
MAERALLLCEQFAAPDDVNRSIQLLLPYQRKVGEDQPVGAQRLQEVDLVELLLEAPGCLARRRGAQPFEMGQTAGLGRRQQLRRPAVPLVPRPRRDVLGQGLLPVPPRGDRETADVPLARQQIVMVDQPGAGPRYQLGCVEHGGGLAAEMGALPPAPYAVRPSGEAAQALGRAELAEHAERSLTAGLRRSAAARNRAAGRDAPAPPAARSRPN